MRGRRGRTPPRAPAPAGPTQATAAMRALSSAATSPATTPPRRAASSSRKTSPARFGSGGDFSRRRRPRSGRPGLRRATARTRCAARDLPRATTTSGSPATCASVPCSITAPGTCDRERPDERRCAGLPRACRRRGAPSWSSPPRRLPSPQPPSAQASTSRAAAVRIPQRKQNGASLAARPVPDSTCEVGLT